MPTRFIGALLVAGGLLLAGAAPVLADAGPHVLATGGTTPIGAESCAGCHRAHAAPGSGPVAGPGGALCFACHGSGAVGATTNVADGVIAGTARGLKGGGFSNARMDTSWTGAATSRPATSVHGESIGVTGTMWGSGPIGSGTGLTGINLTCLNCHDPHGNGNYRILRPIPSGSGATVGVIVADETLKTYGIASTQNRYFGEVYAGGDYVSQLALGRWCASCHARYDGAPAAGHTASGDAVHPYRHSTRLIEAGVTRCETCHDSPEGDTTAGDLFGVTSAIAHRPVCQTCHVAHGSSAAMGSQSASIPYPDGSTPALGSSRSSLLRLDNRGVCGGCHTP